MIFEHDLSVFPKNGRSRATRPIPLGFLIRTIERFSLGEECSCHTGGSGEMNQFIFRAIKPEFHRTFLARRSRVVNLAWIGSGVQREFSIREKMCLLCINDVSRRPRRDSD